jgi:hypothetical protein
MTNQNDKLLKNLIESIKELNENVKKSISLKRSFLMYILYGFGYALGAIIFTTLIVTTLVKTAKYIPYLKDIKFENIEQKINE